MIKLHMSDLILSQADSTYPALSNIPSMQRRRLSKLAKLALNTALSALAEDRVDYIVWVSQYGDENKTFQILSDVLQDQTPSPTQFSTSVHNAISGLYSILCQDATPATSLAGSWNDALVEAYAWLKTCANPHAKVLVVYYEEALPVLYAEYQNFDAFSMGAIFSLDTENLAFNMLHPEKEQFAFKQAQAFTSFWQQQHPQSHAWQKINVE